MGGKGQGRSGRELCGPFSELKLIDRGAMGVNALRLGRH